MSLVDRYKEVLKSQGINANIERYKPKKDRTMTIIALVAIAIMLPLYFIVFQNYSACSVAANAIYNQNISATNSSTLSSPFSLKCATNSALYSASILLAALIICAILYKWLRGWHH